jgi:hypothetical protein
LRPNFLVNQAKKTIQTNVVQHLGVSVFFFFKKYPKTNNAKPTAKPIIIILT